VNVPICFIDTESDGIHPTRKPWEIALILRRPGKPEITWSAFVEIDLSTADLFGLNVGRFYGRHPLGQFIKFGNGGVPPAPNGQHQYVTRRSAALRVAQLTHGAHLVGAVPHFDTEIFDRLLRDHGLAPSWHYHLCDVENLAVGYLAGQGSPLLPPWNSDDLSEALKLDPIPEDKRHTALGDAQFAQKIWDKVMGE